MTTTSRNTTRTGTTDGAITVPTTAEPGGGRTAKNLPPAKREQLDTDRRAEVDGLLTQITDAVTRLHTEPGWLALLAAAARLHTYSFGNQILIALACPEAQAVAGYRAWQALGRNVRKGELICGVWDPSGILLLYAVVVGGCRGVDTRP